MDERLRANKDSDSLLLNRCKEFQADGSTLELEYGSNRNRVTGVITNVTPEYIEFTHTGNRVTYVNWWTIEAITLLPAAAFGVGKG